MLTLSTRVCLTFTFSARKLESFFNTPLTQGTHSSASPKCGTVGGATVTPKPISHPKPTETRRRAGHTPTLGDSHPKASRPPETNGDSEEGRPHPNFERRSPQNLCLPNCLRNCPNRAHCSQELKTLERFVLYCFRK